MENMKQDCKVQYLVVDSGAFIRNAPIHEYGENVITTHGIVDEIKDAATRQRLQFLPYELKFQAPLPENIRYVTDFSKKTGDYPSLSAVDIRIIALTYQLEKEHVGTDHLNKEPIRSKVTAQPAAVSDGLKGFYYPHKVVTELENEQEERTRSEDSDGEDVNEKEHDRSGDSSASEEDVNEKGNDCSDNTSVPEEDVNEKENDFSCKTSAPEEGVSFESKADLYSDLVGSGEVNDEDNDDDDDDYEEHWITPYNIEEVKQKMGMMSITDYDSKSLTVGCITTDFAVQNVLLQMGLHVISVDGMLIKHTKVFILRCYACYRTTNCMTKQFCPWCGNKTLKRVAVSINADGTRKIHINFKKPINIRGTKYSLPMPRGGKHAVNPILCENQPAPENKPPKSALRKIDMLSSDYDAHSSPFAMNDVCSRAAYLGIRKGNATVTKRNPNEPVRRIGKKKRNKRK